jgi:hypothetical protein
MIGESNAGVSIQSMKRHARDHLRSETLELRLPMQLVNRDDRQLLLGIHRHPNDMMPNALTIMGLHTKVPVLLVTADTARLG